MHQYLGREHNQAQNLGAPWEDACSWSGAGSVISGVAEGCSLFQAIGSCSSRGAAVYEHYGWGSHGYIPVHLIGIQSMSMQAADDSKSPGSTTYACLYSFTVLHIS